MRPTRIFYIMVLMCVGLLGAYWVACAQEVRSLWSPPPNVPQDDIALPAFPPLKKNPAPAGVPASSAKRPLLPKSKAKGRSRLPPVVDLPAPVARVQDVDPHPMKPQAEDSLPPPLPVPSIDNVLPLITDKSVPLPELTNVKPKDVPPANDKGGDANTPGPPQIVPEPQEQTQPNLLPIDPVPPGIQPKNAPKPVPLNDLSIIPQPDPNKTPVTDPILKEIPLDKAAKKIPAQSPLANPNGNASVGVIPAPAAIPETTSSEPRNNERPKAFIRLRPTFPKEPISTPFNEVSPRAAPMPVAQPMPGSVPVPAMINPRSRDHNEAGAALVQLQTPTLNVEKRALDSKRIGDALQFQICVRNLSSIPAQHVVIEDTLPADVKFLSASPMPSVQGNKLIWTLPALSPQSESTISLSLKAAATKEWMNLLSIQLSAVSFGNVHSQTGSSNVGDKSKGENLHPSAGSAQDNANSANNYAMRPRLNSDSMTVRLSGPRQVAVGKEVVFEIYLTNQSAQPLQGIVLYGFLPQGLNTPVGRTIEGAVEGQLQPGETKTLKMPANAIQPGRYSVEVKVTAHNTQEVSATTTIEIGTNSLVLQPDLNTRMIAGREGEYRVALTNHSNQVLRNVMVVSHLADGLEFVSASDRGLYQANTRAIHWLIDQLPPGRTQPLGVHVVAAKAGQYQHHVVAKADGIEDANSSGVIIAEGLSDLSLKVIDRDNPLELGRETVYEIHVTNPGSLPSTNVKLQVQFPPGLMPRNAQGATRHAVDRHDVVFEPISALGPQGQAIYRVSAVGQLAGNDQRVRFAVVSDQVRTPITREIGVMVYRD